MVEIICFSLGYVLFEMYIDIQVETLVKQLRCVNLKFKREVWVGEVNVRVISIFITRRMSVDLRDGSQKQTQSTQAFNSFPV